MTGENASYQLRRAGVIERRAGRPARIDIVSELGQPASKEVNRFLIVIDEQQLHLPLRFGPCLATANPDPVDPSGGRVGYHPELKSI